MYEKNDIKITLSPEERKETERMVMLDKAWKMPTVPRKGDLVTASGIGVGVVIEEMYSTGLVKVSWFTQGVFGFAPHTVTEEHPTAISVLAKAT